MIASKRKSAKGAEYDSQGQARKRVAPGNKIKSASALKGRNTAPCISALQALTSFGGT